VDDVFPGIVGAWPGRAPTAYSPALDHVEWLLERHPRLRVTLFTTPDWRQISPTPSRRLLSRVPILRDRCYLAPVLPEGTMRLDRHPAFVRRLKSLPRTETALHGLQHVHHGPQLPVEFQDGDDAAVCAERLNSAIEIFARADLPLSPGFCPPGWLLTPALAEALAATGFTYVGSARDVRTEVSREARSAMSGLLGVSLLYPETICGGRLVHVTTNFQATSTVDRAFAILDLGGVLAIKAHAIKTLSGYVQLDGLDELYRNYLDTLFSELERRYGDALSWTSMGEIAAGVRGADVEGRSSVSA
jgi:hypothetical protein